MAATRSILGVGCAVAVIALGSSSVVACGSAPPYKRKFGGPLSRLDYHDDGVKACLRYDGTLASLKEGLLRLYPTPHLAPRTQHLLWEIKRKMCEPSEFEELQLSEVAEATILVDRDAELLMVNTSPGRQQFSVCLLAKEP